ncbi:Fc.00g009130.m01.CDS01 [Cosmosporella sp. VM-42]
MRSWGCYSCFASLMAALWTVTIEAAEFKRFDGVHRIEKKAQITARAVLGRRDEAVCGTSLTLCPSSLNGGCCPNDYDCAKESCYATTQGPSTCGTKTGWHVCEAKYGGGCCPDGYLCQTAGNCVPPSGSAYTYGCPASHFLCPASLSYGCCKNGMACAINQCYSTEEMTITATMTVTTTKDGSRTTYKTTATTVGTPDAPTNAVPADQDSDQAIFKYFPSAIPKVSPTSSASGGGGGGLSTGTLAGIIAGAVAFLIIILVAAFIIIRHLNKVVAAVSSKQSDSSRARPAMKEFKPTDSEVDALSVDPLMMSPRPSHPPPGSKVNAPYAVVSDRGSNDVTPNGIYDQPSGSERNSRQTSLDAGNGNDYFNNTPGAVARFSQVSSGFSLPSSNRVSNDSHGAYTHVRHWSNASEGSEGNSPGVVWNQPSPSELDGTPYVPELPTTPAAVGSPRDDRRRSSGSIPTVMSRPPVSHQRKRSEQRSRSNSGAQPPLTAVSEEMHGFHGPDDHLVGQTDWNRPGEMSPIGPMITDPIPPGESSEVIGGGTARQN